MKLLITLVNYKTTGLLVKCLDSIRNQKIRTEYRIVVVDNHSQDGGVERLRREYPDVTIIANTSNDGYARAVNQAIRSFDAEYILLLNPDIEVKPGAIETMLKFMEDTQDVGIVAGLDGDVGQHAQLDDLEGMVDLLGLALLELEPQVVQRLVATVELCA